MSEPSYTIATAFAQVEKCDFECEGGPLTNNAGWRWLKERVLGGPKFHMGEWVMFTVEAEVSGVKIAQAAKLCIVAIYMSSDTERRTWTYALSADPPDAYHHGSGVQFNGVSESKLSHLDPAQ